MASATTAPAASAEPPEEAAALVRSQRSIAARKARKLAMLATDWKLTWARKHLSAWATAGASEADRGLLGRVVLSAMEAAMRPDRSCSRTKRMRKKLRTTYSGTKRKTPEIMKAR